jgi:hypothetical protein
MSLPSESTHREAGLGVLPTRPGGWHEGTLWQEYIIRGCVQVQGVVQAAGCVSTYAGHRAPVPFCKAPVGVVPIGLLALIDVSPPTNPTHTPAPLRCPATFFVRSSTAGSYHARGAHPIEVCAVR